MTGVFPECFKSAVVVPILKKPGLDVDMVANYRPISHLSFLSKVFEKVIFKQLTEHLSTSNLFEPFRSAFRPNHSTETALVKVVNDLLVNADNDRTSVLLLLDLSAAFDTVDHCILLDRLEHFIGITGNVLSWLRSYLSGRSQTVSFKNDLSETCAVRHGVPQGSVLGPLLFSMYLLPLGVLLRSFNVTFHCYTDDLQLYVPLTIGNDAEVSKLESCLSAIKGWLSDNFLLLNTDKTELMVIGPHKFQHLSQNFILRIDDSVINCRDKVKNLGVWFDMVLSFESHVKEITKTAFYHLRNIARIRQVLSSDTAEVLVHAFVSSRIDYCNALLSGLPKKSFRGLQMVQNAAARILTRTGKFEHISPVLNSLHWLPCQVRADFKVLLLTYKALNGLAYTYLSDLLHLYVPSRALRSQDSGLLKVPRARKKTVGEQAFSFRAPFLWNNLAQDIRQACSVEVFKTKLKTHLFTLSYMS
uniref:Reverse transcriptase domain-containing protein n=1 Tax=Oreochromis niloticus TaxID=8128 RepID=A0A669B8C0_ORENI